MTHDILPSDVELAEALLRANRPDAEIIGALRLRGVDLVKTAQLIDDLRNGRPVTAVPHKQPRAPKSPAPDDAPAAEPQTRRSRGDRMRSGAGSAGNRSLQRLVVAGLAVLCAAAVVWLLWSRLLHDDKSADRTHVTDAQARVSPRSPSSPAGLVLEIAPDGLRIGSTVVTKQNALNTISGVLGLPTRTNRTDQSGRAVYAYDRHGLLYYSGHGAGNDAIMLDCDAMGGTNGTEKPFAGSLKLEDRTICVDTDADALTSIKQLGLTKLAKETATYKGQCGSLDVYFAYLKTPARLSFIEIDLRE